MTTEQISSLQEIGRNAMLGITEMIDATDKERAAAAAFAKSLSREQCVKILTEECGIQCYDDEDLDELQDAVAANIEDETCSPDGFEFDEDDARERIQEDPLEITVRSDWVSTSDEMKPSEYCILLATGGPAVRIIGDLEDGEATSAKLQTQEWGTPWTDYKSLYEEDEDLLTYARNFYFGS